MSNPTMEMARLMPGACNQCGAWAQLGKMRLCHVCHNARYDALENLAECAGMWCERLPAEVAEALHAIPGIEVQHQHEAGKGSG